MSDPVTNVEIEDVLASIRKLVSHGDRAEPVRAAEADESRDDAAERLVLTPALRVSEASETVDPDTHEVAPADAGETVSDAPVASERVADSEPIPLIWRVVELDAGESSHTDNFAGSEKPLEHAAEGSEFRVDAPLPVADQPQTAPSHAADPMAEFAGSIPLALTQTPDADPPEADSPTGPESAAADAGKASPTDGDSRAALMATIAELEAAVDNGDNWEPDGSEPEPQVNWEELAVPPGVVVLTEPAVQSFDDPTEVGGDPVEGAPADGTPPSLEDQGPAPSVDAAVPEDLGFDEAEDLDEDLSAFMSEASEIDEDTLRDLVAQIVREELQGALGERITRNVRKLVRREIYRILSSQEFD